MRNFLHHNNPFRKNNNRKRDTSRNHFAAEILDTDEDRVMNQYEVYVSYLKKIKKELVKGGEALMGYKRGTIATQ
jgi:hypothetical protein